MSTGTWFALCARERLISLDELARLLGPYGDLAPRLAQENLLVVAVHDSLTGNDADVRVSIDAGPHVAAEASELLAELESGDLTIDEWVPPPDRDALGRADARYELTWELRFSDETYNPMLFICGELVQACGAIIYDATNHRFV